MSQTFHEYESCDAVGLAELVRSGDVHASELLDAAIVRSAERNPTLNAIVIDMEKEARTASEAGLPEGPLRGVPFLIKDLHLLCAGVRTSDGSRRFRDFVADHDSEIVARYKRAGARTPVPRGGGRRPRTAAHRRAAHTLERLRDVP